MSFALLLGGALVFTNAVEWAGSLLGLGQGAVGSLLAAVATALPETLVPIVAIIGGASGSGDVAVGAIIGAPFMLATIAMALVGLSALLYRGRREHGRHIAAHQPTLRLDLAAFLVFFGAGLVAGVVSVGALSYVIAGLLLIGYVAYVALVVRRAGAASEVEDLPPLYLDRTKGDPPHTWQVVAQLVGGLAAIAYGAHLFVAEVEVIAEDLGVPILVLALILAPLATELPEKINSFLWIRRGEDTLALGNVTGAMVFQSTIPISIGLLFTDWELGRAAVVASLVALAGGALAVWAGTIRKRFSTLDITLWAALFVGFVIYVVLTS